MARRVGAATGQSREREPRRIYSRFRRQSCPESNPRIGALDRCGIAKHIDSYREHGFVSFARRRHLSSVNEHVLSSLGSRHARDLTIPTMAGRWHLTFSSKGINVGGHRNFRPSVLARDLTRFDVVNVGAAGTFVIRKPVSRVKLRAEILRRLPFEAEVVICDSRDFLRLASEDPSRGNRPNQTSFGS